MNEGAESPSGSLLLAGERSPPEPAAHSVTTRAFAIGETVTALPGLVALNGETCSLHSFDGNDALVLAFLGDACPAVKACAESLVGLQQTLGPRRAKLIGVNSNNPYMSPRDTLAEMTRWAGEMNLNFPYLKDPEGAVARRLGVTNTPHFVVLDQAWRLRYRGRMFDSRDPVRATTHDLEDAVESVLAGRPIGIPETHPLGCSIVW